MSQSTRGQYEGNFLEGIFRVGIMIRKSQSIFRDKICIKINKIR